MEKLQVAVVYGTRPEAIKVAPVISALRNSEKFRPWVISTGQHRDLLHGVQQVLDVKADIDLDLYKPGSTLDDIVGRAVIELGAVLDTHKPDAVIVHGDTSTTLAAALADFHHHVPVVHLEAGLRTHDLTSPFPEEANRRLVAQITRLHLAPTAAAAGELAAEGIHDGVHVIGNTAIDALLHTVGTHPQLSDELNAAVNSAQRVVTVTVHRRENWGDGLTSIAEGVARSAHDNPDVAFIAPLHPNPTLRAQLAGTWATSSNIHIVDAAPYDQFCHLMSKSSLILSDSGGVQEEAPVLGVPLGVLRNTTERAEVLATGQAALLGTGADNIHAFTTAVLSEPELDAMMSGQTSPFGDGHAAERAIQAIAHMFGLGDAPLPYKWHGQLRGQQVQDALIAQGVVFDAEDSYQGA